MVLRKVSSIGFFLLCSLVCTFGFAPSLQGNTQKGSCSSSNSLLFSTAEVDTEASTESAAVESPPEANGAEDGQSTATALSGAEIMSRLEKQLEKLKSRDANSLSLSKEDIKVVYEDEHILVVDKPAGVLSVPNKEGNSNLATAVYEAFGCDMGRADKMVVHRLGMDTSGLVVFAKTMVALRGMNTIFRTRKIERKYEALVCGHMEKDEGIIDLPVMRDYEYPPFMRISTFDHQMALIDLEAEEVGKKILEQPKDSITKYEVVGKEEYEGQPVTRVTLTSVSGRTHQLNVHLAALGHPIVGDAFYGLDGDAAANGGLTDAELENLAPNPARASADVQKAISGAAQGKTCVHAKSLKFRHPVTKEDISLEAASPF